MKDFLIIKRGCKNAWNVVTTLRLRLDCSGRNVTGRRLPMNVFTYFYKFREHHSFYDLEFPDVELMEPSQGCKYNN